jgi:hypothetical protein
MKKKEEGLLKNKQREKLLTHFVKKNLGSSEWSWMDENKSGFHYAEYVVHI